MKSFEVEGTTFVKDYMKKNNELGLLAALCIGAIGFFVLKLSGAI